MKIFKISRGLESHFFNIDDFDLYNELGFRDQIGFGLDADMDLLSRVKFYVDVENGPKHKIMDFMGFSLSIVIQTNKNTDRLLSYFEKGGQIIPLNMLQGKSYDNLKCSLFNITKIVDCFNEKNSECKYFHDGVRLMDIRRYAFYEEKIPDGIGFFTIPDTPGKSIFLAVGINKPEEDFYFLYHKLGMTGLEFKEIYRTPGEKDYDLEGTIKVMNNGEELEKTLFEKSLFGKLFS